MNSNNSILIVEDDPVNVEIYRTMLQNKYKLLIAENGKRAEEVMEQTPPDIVLLDIMLPDANGVDLCRKFKNADKSKHIPLILVTALDQLEDKLKGLQAGANDYLNKPVDELELQLKIKNHLIIQEQYTLIKKQNEEINRFVDVMLHDLKNPLTVIMGYIELIYEMSTDDFIVNSLKKVSASSEQMLDNINRVLDIQKRERRISDIDT